jgi:hypothetical protein
MQVGPTTILSTGLQTRTWTVSSLSSSSTTHDCFFSTTLQNSTRAQGMEWRRCRLGRRGSTPVRQGHDRGPLASIMAQNQGRPRAQGLKAVAGSTVGRVWWGWWLRCALGEALPGPWRAAATSRGESGKGDAHPTDDCEDSGWTVGRRRRGAPANS